MKFKWEDRYFRFGLTAFLVVAASMLFYFGIFKMKTIVDGIGAVFKILTPILYGAVLAYLLSPIVNFMEQKLILPLLEKKKLVLDKKGRRTLRYTCVILALTFFGVMIYTLIMMILPQILQSMVNIVNSFPTYVDVIQEKLLYIAAHTDRLDPSVASSLEEYANEAQNYLTTNVLPELQKIFLNVSAGVFDVLAFVKNFLIGAIVSLYLMADKEAFIAKGKMLLCAVLPIHRANAVMRALRLTDRSFGGFITGKIIDSLIIGVLCYIGTIIMGTPYAVLISVVIGVTNVIPFFGPYVGAIPCILLILLIEPIQALYFLIFILVLQQFDGNILGPKILGGSTGLSSFMVIVAILVGGGLFGIPGMIAGVPIFAVLYALIWGFIRKSLHKKNLPLDERDYYNLERIHNLTHEPVLFESEDHESAFSKIRGSEAASKRYNIMEMEEIFSEMSNPDYEQPVSVIEEIEKEEEPKEKTRTMILMEYARKYLLIAWELLKKYLLRFLHWFVKRGGETVDKGVDASVDAVLHSKKVLDECPDRIRACLHDRGEQIRSRFSRKKPGKKETMQEAIKKESVEEKTRKEPWEKQ